MYQRHNILNVYTVNAGHEYTSIVKLVEHVIVLPYQPL